MRQVRAVPARAGCVGARGTSIAMLMQHAMNREPTMNRFSTTLIAVAALTMATIAGAGNDLPEPTHSRVILHGVDCAIDDGTVCDQERPVFDEAAASVPSTADVVIQMGVLDGRDREPARRLPNPGAEAVRDYFVGVGIAPERVEIEGHAGAPGGLVDGSVPIEVQLSHTVN